MHCNLVVCVKGGPHTNKIGRSLSVGVICLHIINHCDSLLKFDPKTQFGCIIIVLDRSWWIVFVRAYHLPRHSMDRMEGWHDSVELNKLDVKMGEVENDTCKRICEHNLRDLYTLRAATCSFSDSETSNEHCLRERRTHIACRNH